MKKLVKLLVGVAIIAFLLFGGLTIYNHVHRTSIAHEAATAAGVDEQTYQDAKSFAKNYGIDLDNDAQVTKILGEHADDIDELADVAEGYKSGKLTEQEAITEAASKLGTTPKELQKKAQEAGK